MSAAQPRSLLLVVLSALVALQALALLAIGVFYLVEVGRNAAADVRGAVFGAVVALVVGLGLLAAARGLVRGRRWARAPVLVVQLLVALVAAGPDGFLGGGFWYVAVPLLLWALTVGALLFAPAVSAELDE